MTTEQKTILVVEDDPDTLVYFRTLLEDHGYRVVTAQDAAAALNLVSEGRPDLITLDINLPESSADASGVKFYRWMKESEEWKHIPVIIVTGMMREFQRFISTRRQVPPPEGYLSKPIQQADLLAEVDRHLAA